MVQDIVKYGYRTESGGRVESPLAPGEYAAVSPGAVVLYAVALDEHGDYQMVPYVEADDTDTKAALVAKLDALGIDAPSRATKAELVTLLAEHAIAGNGPGDENNGPTSDDSGDDD